MFLTATLITLGALLVGDALWIYREEIIRTLRDVFKKTCNFFKSVWLKVKRIRRVDGKTKVEFERDIAELLKNHNYNECDVGLGLSDPTLTIEVDGNAKTDFDEGELLLIEAD